MLISSEKIQEIIAQADLVSIISASIPVQKKGRNYWAVCPFHDDSNPSMSISPEKKIYKCFSCGASGNAIDFVKNYQHVDFLTALKTVVETTNITLDELNNHQYQSKYSLQEELLFQINAEALNFYMVLLAAQPGEMAKNYLSNRQISKNEILKWQIGYASSKIPLYPILLEKGYKIEDLVNAGLVSVKNGEIYDYFFDRIIFPIKNEDEKVIGFSGRTLTDSQPKYLNTRETLIFKKSNVVFNQAPALKAANMKKSLIVLEGFMDVISLVRIGWENSLALMGTNFSDYHLQWLKKANVEVKLFLDGDQAGVNATLKAAKKLLKQKNKVSVIDNLTNQDPDELIRQGQKSKVELMIDHSVYPTIYAMDKLVQFYDLAQPTALKEYLSEVFALLVIIDDPITNEKSLKSLVEVTNLSWETLNQSFTSYQNQHHVKSAPTPAPPNDWVNLTPTFTTITSANQSGSNKHLTPLRNYELSQREILHSLITSQHNITQIEKNLGYIVNPDLFVVLQEIINRYKKGTYHENNWAELAAVLEFSTFDYTNPKWKINPADLAFAEDKNINLDDAFLLLQEYKLKKQEAYYTKQIKISQNPNVQKKWLEAKEKIHFEIINLRKKRGKIPNE